MKAIIFDFDGTLANTLPICYYAFQNVFKQFNNKVLTSEEIKAMFGPSETGIIRENLINTNKEQAIEMYYSDADIQAGSEANVHTVGLRWLQGDQTSEFKIEPNSIFNSVHHFVDFINIGCRHEL